jgi:CspA family cold shock protein
MARGTVKWFSEEKGYGFITPDEGGRDVFVHYTGIADGGFRTLAEGARVEYDVREGEKGAQAINVALTGEPARPRPAPARREARPAWTPRRGVRR